jgi:hypothetical protein
LDRLRANSTISTALLVTAIAVGLFALTFFVAVVYIG